MKAAHTALVMIALAAFLSGPRIAQASTFSRNTVENMSRGQIGVADKVHIRDRHDGDEYYLVKMQNPDASTADRSVYLAFEIMGVQGQSFYPFVHIRFADGDFPPNDEYMYVWTSWPVQTEAWHYLKIQRRTASVWDLYYDGRQMSPTGVYWPYPNNCTTSTNLEANWTNPVSFMGRHDEIQIKAGNGIWYWQNASWEQRIGVDYFNTQWDIYFNDAYYDWEARY